MNRLAVVLLASLALAATPRSAAVRRAFMKATGYPHGRPGFIIDHRVPLCAGGPDAVANLIWQPIAEAKRKDVEEKKLCARIRRDVAAFTQRWTPR